MVRFSARSFAILLFLLPIFAQTLHAQSGPVTYCFPPDSKGRVYCYQVSDSGEIVDVPPPPRSGGSFSMESSSSVAYTANGQCSETEKRELCEAAKIGCRLRATIGRDNPRDRQGFSADEMLKMAQDIAAASGAPRTKILRYNFSWSLSCDARDLGGEPPKCHYSTECTVRGDFSY